jgi:transcriptional regulator with XRE-family HTH domain
MAKAGMTQEEVADGSGMNVEQVGRFIRGQGNPTYDTLQHLCSGLPVSLGELVTLAEELEERTDASPRRSKP